MVSFDRRTAILISVMVGIIILPFIGIKGLFSIIVIGFIANYLTVDKQRNYIIGAAAGCIIGIIVFLFGFLATPTLPDIPSISTSKLISLELQGLFTLVLGFFALVISCTSFGAVGGAIVQKLFKKESSTEKYNKQYKKTNKPQKSFITKLIALNGNKSQKSFNGKPRRNLNKNKRRKSFNDKPRKSLNKKY